MTDARIQEIVAEACSQFWFESEEEKAEVIERVVGLVKKLLNYFPTEEEQNG